MDDAWSVVIITSRNSIARKATNFHAISTAYNAPYNTLCPQGDRDVTPIPQPPAFPRRAYPLPAGPCSCIQVSQHRTHRSVSRRKGANLVVTPMAQGTPVSLREAARIEGRTTLRTTKTRFVPRLANCLDLVFIPTNRELSTNTNGLGGGGGAHLLCEVHVLGATRALRRPTTPLPHRAASVVGTQLAHERRAVPRSGGARGQRCNPARPGATIPAEGVRTAESRGNVQGGRRAFCRGRRSIGGAGERNRPRESAFRAPGVRWRGVRVVASLICRVIGAVGLLRVGAEATTGGAQHTRRTKERPGGACGVPEHPRVLSTDGWGGE